MYEYVPVVIFSLDESRAKYIIYYYHKNTSVRNLVFSRGWLSSSLRKFLLNENPEWKSEIREELNRSSVVTGIPPQRD